MIFEPKWKEANVNVTIFKKSKMFGSINQTQAVSVLSAKKNNTHCEPKTISISSYAQMLIHIPSHIHIHIHIHIRIHMPCQADKTKLKHKYICIT